MYASVINLPGSNCYTDAVMALQNCNYQVDLVWHKDNTIKNNTDLIIIPGGFSYGDYLRAGAVAALSPIMQEVKKFADRNVPIIGICNGFQILTELQLLPGSLLINNNLKFIHKSVHLKTENNSTVFTNKLAKQQIIELTIANKVGNYFIDQQGLQEINDNEQIAFRYCNKFGNINNNTNPNGSTDNIAGIFNKNKTILGLMPHPERETELITGGIDGKLIFDSILNSINN